MGIYVAPYKDSIFPPPLLINDYPWNMYSGIKVDRYKSGLFCSTIAYTLDSDKPQTDEERHVQSSDQENRRPMGPYGVDHAWSFRRGSYEELSPMDFSVSAEQVFMYLTPQGKCIVLEVDYELLLDPSV